MSSGDLSDGAEAGIGVGVSAIGVSAICFGVWLYTRRRKQKRQRLAAATLDVEIPKVANDAAVDIEKAELDGFIEKTPGVFIADRGHKPELDASENTISSTAAKTPSSGWEKVKQQPEIYELSGSHHRPKELDSAVIHEVPSPSLITTEPQVTELDSVQRYEAPSESQKTATVSQDNAHESEQHSIKPQPEYDQHGHVPALMPVSSEALPTYHAAITDTVALIEKDHVISKPTTSSPVVDIDSTLAASPISAQDLEIQYLESEERRIARRKAELLEAKTRQ